MTTASMPVAGDLDNLLQEMGRQAREAAADLARSDGAQRNAALRHAAERIRAHAAEIISANEKDMRAAQAHGLSAAMLDRLALDESRVEAMAAGLEAIAALKDPLGAVLEEWQRPNGLRIQRVRVPLGVIGIIYESRPNVTADAGGLCLKAGNAAILRGGSESYHSSTEILKALQWGLDQANLPPSAIQMIPTRDREAVGILLRDMSAWVDVIVPRGGKGLISRVQQDARVPVMGHLEGLCHVYVHAPAQLEMAKDVVLNAKLRRTGICGAAETLLIDESLPVESRRALVLALLDAGCEVRGDSSIQSVDDRVVPATQEDWETEYLDAIISVAVVPGLQGATDHIQQYGSGHTEAIVTDDDASAEAFFRELDSAILLHNASTQFADGGEFGMGAEIGIATGKLHARGPVGAEQLTSYKYVVRGSGQTRP